MEIRISLDRLEPPAGRLRLVPDPGPAPSGPPREVPFTGWLGLLRALYELVGTPAAGRRRATCGQAEGVPHGRPAVGR